VSGSAGWWPWRKARPRNLRRELVGLLERARNDAAARGGLSEEALTILANILENGDLRVEDVMVPRVDVVAVAHGTPFPDLVRCMVAAAHSRVPVYRGDLDEVVGMIHVKDVLGLVQQQMEDGRKPVWQEKIRPVLFVAPSMRVLDLLARMRMERVHMAIVVDEYGGTDGLVTIEDLIEQIVGEIVDEHEVEPREMVRALGAGRFDADARLALDEFEALIGIALPRAEEEDVDTLGGLVVTLAGRVPEIGARIRHESGLRFEVLDADPRRVKRVRVVVPRGLRARDQRATAGNTSSTQPPPPQQSG